MSFNYCSVEDGNLASDLNKFIKYSGGFFKSKKQADYFLGYRNSDFVIKYAGLVDVPEHKLVLTVDGTAQWADYGRRSIVMVSWVYLLDQYGVVAQYKLGYNGNMRDGCSVNPKKTKLIWARPEDAKLPVFEEPKDVLSNHIGEVKSRIEVTGKVVSMFPYSSRFGEGIKTTIDCSGNLVVVWKQLYAETEFGEVPIQKGDTVSLSAKVKSHDEWKGVKSTTCTHPKNVKIA